MRFDVLSWAEIDPALSFHQTAQGRVWVRATVPVAVFIQTDETEALAGVGHEVDVTVAEGAAFRVEAPKGARVFAYAPYRQVIEASPEVFTNADLMPLESGSVLAVKEELRRFRLEQREARLKAIAAERERLARVTPVDPPAPPPAPVVDPEPSPQA